MKVDEKTKRAKAYMQRLVKKMESDHRGSLSYAEKQGLGMFDALKPKNHIGTVIPDWHKLDENEKGEVLNSLSVKDLKIALSYDDDNATPLLFSLTNEARVTLLEKMVKADLIFEPLHLMQQKNRYGESLLEVTSYDKVYGPRMGKLFGEVSGKADHCRLVHNVHQKLKKKKEEEQAEELRTRRMRKDHRSY